MGETALTGTLSEALPNGLRTFETVRVAPDIARDLSARHIPFSGVTESGWASGIVSWFGWILILFAVWSMAGLSGMRTGGGLLSIGRSKAKLFAETDISVKFNDVAGVDEAKEELREVVDFLQKPGEFSRLGAHATNRPEILDPALLRAGRFDRQILVDRPEKSGRAQILAIHTRRVLLAPGMDLDRLAALTPGFTGADLANLVNEAAMIATRRSADAVSIEDFEAAIERIVAGLEKKSRILSLHERSIVAHHEMGHALVAMAIPGSDPAQKVSIIPRGIGALGYTIQRPTEDRFLIGSHELEDKMTILMAGRAAEQLVFSEVSTGGADDLAKVTDIARGMVMRYGMDETLGAVCHDTEPGHLLGQPQGAFRQPRHYGEASASRIDAAVRALVEAAASRASDILRQNRAVLEQGANRLLDRETLAADELPQPLPESAGAEGIQEEHSEQLPATMPAESKDAAEAPLCALDTH